jgi:hypothetical protein
MEVELGLTVAQTADGKEGVYPASEVAFRAHFERGAIEASSPPLRFTFAGERTSDPALSGRASRLAHSVAVRDVGIWKVEPGKPPKGSVAAANLVA